jgi:restriction system protein
MTPTDEVLAGLDLAAEAIRSVAEDSRRALAAGALQHDPTELVDAASRLRDLSIFHDRVVELQHEWCVLRPVSADSLDPIQSTHSRLERGVRTPQDRFRLPILESLVELGGKAPLHQVLDLVEIKLSGVLNATDFEHLPSNSKVIRWINTAQWERNAMVAAGLLAPVAQRGVWEITPAGRALVSPKTQP